MPPASDGERVPAAAVGLGAGESVAIATTLRRKNMANMTAMGVACFAIVEGFERRGERESEGFADLVRRTKVGNGARRPDDVLSKIEKISSRSNKISQILKMLQSLSEKRVGIQIKAEKLSLGNKPSYDIYDENFNLNLNIFDRVFKFSRSQPRIVPTKPEAIVEDLNQSHICGVVSRDGSVCGSPPIKGRKRCSKHKGRRLTSVFINQNSNSRTNNIVYDEVSPACGVIMLDGSPCTRSPFPGRKRCEEHKGMRVNQILSKSSIFKSVCEKPLSNPDPAVYCGVNLGDGKCCARQPVKGRKRCEQHKGMRVKACV